MTIDGNKHVGDTGHVADHNAIEIAILTLQAAVNGISGGGASAVPAATANTRGVSKLTNDFGGTADAPTVVATHLTSALPVVQGGTGATAIDWLRLTTAQGASGVKTFYNGVIVPTTPPGSNYATSKSYVDALVSTTSIVDVTKAPYNADKTGTTGASTAINNAITAVAGTGGSVYIPAGIYKVDAKIVMKMRVRVFGDGHWSSRLVAAAGLNDHVVENTISSNGILANGEFTVLEDIHIDGNASNLSAGTYYGLHHDMNPQYDWAPSSGPPYNDIEFDPHHIVRNVMITNTKSDGYHGEGRSETYLDRLFTFKCGRYGIRASFDSFLNHCTAAWSASNGFHIADSSVRGTGCKAFYNGQTTVGGSDGHGFFFTNGQGGINFVAIEAQDNAGAGFALNNCQRAYIQGIADTNSNGHVNNTVSAGSYPAIDIWASYYNHIDVVAYERKAYDNTSYQIYALQIRSSSQYNNIRIMHSATTYNGAAVSTAVMTTSTAVSGNKIVINNLEGVQNIAYSATITPDPYAGGMVIVGALTGNITVNDPPTNSRHIGARFTMDFLQDATGSRTVTWGSGYKPGAFVITATANQPSSIEFVWDGTSWRRCG